MNSFSFHISSHYSPMTTNGGSNLVALLLVINLLLLPSAASDTLTPAQSIVDGSSDTLVSSGSTFELGFFSPPGSTSRYVGIWYKNIPIQTVVWVANRSNPLNTTSGVLNLTRDGNLSLHGGASTVTSTLWSTNTSSLTNPTVQLLDSGNLALSDGSSTTRWQSFDHPSDTLIPGMSIGIDPSINLDRRLTSWKDVTDPSPGVYTLGVYPRAAPDLYIRNGSEPVFRSGPWDGITWGGSPVLKSRALVDNKYTPPSGTQGGGFFSFDMVNASQIARIVMDTAGMVQILQWLNQQWSQFWVGPATLCDVFAYCGRFGLCDNQDSPICKCLPGFVSRSQENFGPSDGPVCTRRTPLNCTSAGDGFLNVPAVKLPATANAAADGSRTFEECSGRCLRDCNCTGFAFFGGSSGCVSWAGDLMDVRQWPQGVGRDFYVRVAASELHSPDQGKGRNTRLIIIIIPSIGLFIFGALGCILWTRRHRRKERRQARQEQSRFISGSPIPLNFEVNAGGIKSPLFHYSAINIATNSFSAENKLGEGGFGPVYKGQLHDGQEIAVKRLATHSGQGVQEFENEILLIAKLQHVNLVRLLGCCIQDEEKMLVYEYMPNKSLDFYIFDPTKQLGLGWQTRFHIIEGIAQGLSYLHKHSRLRIIHRDLKASNILLDSDMNPKISDFGIARIFGSNEVQEQTRKVIGTYGYMAPEYAAEGIFSVKSDVFSFGVMLLEIITGKRNNHIYQNLNSQTLLGHAWELWIESRWLELVDPSLDGACNMNEICRCIHVALMCVQESFVERPTMSEVITALSSENIPLAEPKQPAFFNLRAIAREGLVQDISKGPSVNNMTLTALESR